MTARLCHWDQFVITIHLKLKFRCLVDEDDQMLKFRWLDFWNEICDILFKNKFLYSDFYLLIRWVERGVTLVVSEQFGPSGRVVES